MIYQTLALNAGERLLFAAIAHFLTAILASVNVAGGATRGISMQKKTNLIVRGALVAGLYVALTLLTGELSFGIALHGIGLVQFRPAEALVALPALYPEAIWGLYLGCLAANLYGGLGPWDVLGGSAVTLLAAYFTWKLRRTKWYLLPPIVLNSFLISLYLRLIFKLPYWPTALGIMVSEAVVVIGLGMPLVAALRRVKT